MRLFPTNVGLAVWGSSVCVKGELVLITWNQ